MKELWDRVIAWYKGNAPPEFFPLADSGATEDELQFTESILGQRFPSDLRATYSLFNGSKDENAVYRNYYLMSLTELIDYWKIQCKVKYQNLQAYDVTGPIKKVFWNPRWIRFTDSGAGDGLCVDLDPAAGGVVGQIIVFSHEVGPLNVIAPSFRSWLAGYAADLEAGKYFWDDTSEQASSIEKKPHADRRLVEIAMDNRAKEQELLAALEHAERTEDVQAVENAVNGLALCYVASRKFLAAGPFWRRVAELLAKSTTPDSAELGIYLHNMAAFCLIPAGLLVEARKALLRSREIYGAHFAHDREFVRHVDDLLNQIGGGESGTGRL
jgi:cell wall assembly regulator SMI1